MIGWIGSLFLSFCGFPQALKAYRDGNAKGLDVTFLFLWTAGEVLTLIAVLRDMPVAYLLFNYAANIIFLSIIWYYYINPRPR